MTDQMNELTQEQKVENIKANLQTQINIRYQALIDIVRNIPLNERLADYAYMNFDQGIMWVNQAMRSLQFEVTDPGEECVTEVEEVPEVKPEGDVV